MYRRKILQKKNSWAINIKNIILRITTENKTCKVSFTVTVGNTGARKKKPCILSWKVR